MSSVPSTTTPQKRGSPLRNTSLTHADRSSPLLAKESLTGIATVASVPASKTSSPLLAPNASTTAATAAASAASEQEKKKGSTEFIQRVVFTLIMAYGFLALVSMGVVVLIPAVLFIEVTMFQEILRINQKERKYRQMPYFQYLPWYFLAVTVFTVTAYHVRGVVLATYPAAKTFYQSFGLLTFSFYITGFVAFVMNLKKGLYKYQIGQFTWIAMTLLFIVGQGSLQVSNMLRGVFWFLLPISCVVHNDIWAYAWGKSFGRTKLLRLSPKKTVEGFAGSWLFTTIWAFWFSGFMSNFPSLICPKEDLFAPLYSCDVDPLFIHAPTPVPSWVTAATFGHIHTLYIAPVQYHSLVFAAFASLIAPFGGFFASGLKRAWKLKDFGALIPGHGGMTDRMDCQIITGMFTYVYLTSYVFAEPKCASYVELLRCVKDMPAATQALFAKEVLAGL